MSLEGPVGPVLDQTYQCELAGQGIGGPTFQYFRFNNIQSGENAVGNLGWEFNDRSDIPDGTLRIARGSDKLVFTPWGALEHCRGLINAYYRDIQEGGVPEGWPTAEEWAGLTAVEQCRVIWDNATTTSGGFKMPTVVPDYVDQNTDEIVV